MYRKFQEAGTGLEHMMEWLDDEDAILAKVPLLERDKIEVSARQLCCLDEQRQGYPIGVSYQK